ncbi:MAG: GNAT family N-acetyltransferase [Pseudomonadota bacterium]
MTTTVEIPTLETKRLRLRAAEWSDFEAFAAFRASPRSKGVGGPYTRDQAFDQLAELIGHWHLRGYGRWIVADKATDAPLGVVGPYYPEDWPEPEIAWAVFGETEGKGIAHEAALASRTYAYDTLGWSTAISCIFPDNARSIALAERMGARRDGTLNHATLGQLGIWRHPAPEAA